MKSLNGILLSGLCLSSIALAHGGGVESAGKVGDFEYLQVDTAIPEGLSSPPSAAGTTESGGDVNFTSLRKNRPGSADPNAFSYASDRPKAEVKPGAGPGLATSDGAGGSTEQQPSSPKETKDLDWRNPMSAVVSTGNERGEVKLVEYGVNRDTGKIEKIRIDGQTEDVDWPLGTRKKLATQGGGLKMKAGRYTLQSLGAQQSAASG